MAETFGTAAIPEEKITELIREYFKLTPKAIIETLDLRRPIYKPPPPTATSAAVDPASPGSAPTALMLSAKPPV